jgi:hypothetical protein
MKHTHTLSSVLAILLSASTVLAHEGRDHIAGTVTRAERGQIQVRGADGKNVAIAVTAATVYMRGKESAAFVDVKPGTHLHYHRKSKFLSLESRTPRVCR